MLTPANSATSPRRSPGTRRRPLSGSPTSAGVILARRELTKARISVRLSTQHSVGTSTPVWDVLSVNL